jgi:sugar phosphate isomerase/epimerase
MVVGINQSCIMQARFEEFLLACFRTGISEVELRVPKLIEAHYHLSPDRMRELIRESGVAVRAINSLEDFGLVPPENLDILRREVETMRHFCETCDCNLVVAPVARWFEPAPDREWIMDLSAKRLRFIADILEPAGITIGLEPIAYRDYTIWTLEESHALIERSGARNVSLVADVYNLIRGSSTIESMCRYGRDISMIHLDDAPSRRFSELDLVHARTFPGEGVLQPSSWVHAAQDGGFTGHLSIEVFPQKLWAMEPLEAAKICANHCRSFADLLAESDRRTQ